jgi:hypothetical protein
MAMAEGLPVEAAAPRQPAYVPNYQNVSAVTAALEGMLGGTACAATPSTSTDTAAVTHATDTPASRHTNLRQGPQIRRATAAITEVCESRVCGQGRIEGRAEIQQPPTNLTDSVDMVIEVGGADLVNGDAQGPPQPNAAPPAQGFDAFGDDLLDQETCDILQARIADTTGD